ncbi:MAG: sugar ABC transporter ATP-binding protein [Peptoniphilaceae bacterium]|nr:sugar ABC transporter ATP-binding protein [Peptoniphilaceae bacterium]
MQTVTLEARNISIEFPGVKALDDVNFTLHSGEICAVVGANGAGKSTLMKVLSGANPTYQGTIYRNGQKVELRNPADAQKLGIQIVYQEVDTALVPTLSVAENIMLSDLVMHSGFVMEWKRVRREARKALDRLNMTSIDEKEQVQNLTLAQKQMVLIAKAIRSQCDFLILDEPTAPLSQIETEELFQVVRRLKAESNLGIVFISHRLNEVLEICESYTVMKNGRVIGTAPVTQNTTTNEIIEKMLGRSLNQGKQERSGEIGEVLLKVEKLSIERGKLTDINFEVRRGEIVGIGGLAGAGKSELCKTLFGVYKMTGGKVSLNGKKLNIRSSSAAVKAGLALVPEERRKEGILVQETVAFNLSVATLQKFCTMSFINKKKVSEHATGLVNTLEIKTPSIAQKVANLSGGNQQKVAVGKWLSADSDIYIFDEPTKGVDVGAKQDIFRLICDIAARGKGVIYATSENTELLSLTDRIYVMYNGQIMAEMDTKDSTDEKIMYYAVGGKKEKEN